MTRGGAATAMGVKTMIIVTLLGALLAGLFLAGFTVCWVRHKRSTFNRTPGEAREARRRIRATIRRNPGRFLTTVLRRGWPTLIMIFILALVVVGTRLWWLAALLAVGVFSAALLVPLGLMRWIIGGGSPSP